jgi:hypothetical protein
MVGLFGLTAFVGAALLFAVEPMAAKAILPMLGGSASVWSTCLAFFQTALLIGYWYAHVTSWLTPRVQALVHGLFLAACVLLQPEVVASTANHPPAADAAPSAWLVWTLARTIGLPFVALAATSSILQRWAAALRRGKDSNPYPLYVASNFGSLLALLAYPLLIEPRLSLAAQARGWRLGFFCFAALMALCAATTASATRAFSAVPEEAARPIVWRKWLIWVALAFVPSSLLQGVTTYISTDIAPVPLLWIVPLALYLLSFILTFTQRTLVPRSLITRLVPIFALILIPPLAAGLVQWFWLPTHLLFFFAAALACHSSLYSRRPEPVGLTAFYLAIALGGVLGSLFNAIIAPAIFDRMAEYPLDIVLACLAASMDQASGQRHERLRSSLAMAATILVLSALLATDVGGISTTALGAMSVSIASGVFVYVVWTHRRRPLAFALSIGTVLLGTGLSPGVDGRVLRRERDFYGSLRVTQDDKAQVRRLFHGWTLHGQQSIEPGKEREPTTYYLPGGPGWQVFQTFNSRADAERASVSIVGLGIGSLACFAKPGQDWTFYELDPAVEAIARDASLFTYLPDSPAMRVRVVTGDARLRLADAPNQGFGLIVLDAFNSDAIPVHLLTREALTLYLQKRAPHGLVAFHISNSYLDLEPILDGLARERGMVSRIRRDLTLTDAEKKIGKQRTIWVILADNAEDLGTLADDPRWEPTRPGRGAWTDDRSSLLDVLKIGASHGRR